MSELILGWCKLACHAKLAAPKLTLALPNQFFSFFSEFFLPKLTLTFLVHRIAAFAFAFAMAIPRCQWRHRCVVILGKFLVVLYSNHCGERKNGSKGGKAMCAM